MRKNNLSGFFYWHVFQVNIGQNDCLSDLTENRYEAVEAKGDSTVRGTATAQGLQQMTQRCRVFTQNIFKDELLELGIMDSNRSSADFEPVKDKVVMQATDLERLGVDELQVVRMRLSEGVMGRF